MATKPVTPAGQPQLSEDVKGYTERLEMAGKWAERNFIKRADRMVRYYEIQHYEDKQNQGRQSSEDRIKVPYPYANTRQILAEIAPNDPDPIVKPKQKPKPSGATMSQVFGFGTMLAKPQDPTKLASKLKLAVQYARDHSNFGSEFESMSLYGITTGFGAMVIKAQKNSKMPRFESLTHREVHFACYEVKDPYDSSWVAFKIVRELKDVRSDPNFNGNKSYVQSSKLDPKMFQSSDQLQYDPRVAYATLWDYYNMKEDEHCVFPDGQSFALLTEKITDTFDFETENDDFKCGSPFVFFVNEKSITSPYGLGDIFPIESQVRELDKTRTQMINHRKRYNRKYLVKKNFLDAAGMNQLRNPEDGTIVETTGNIDPSQIQPLQDAPMSADVYQVDEIIQRDIQIVQPIGPNSLVRGVGDQPDTLGQAQLVEQNSNNRLGEKQKVLAKCYARGFSLMAQYIMQYWVTKESFLVQGDGSGDNDWLDFDPGEFKGMKFEYDVAPESLKDNTQRYRQDAQQALLTAVPLLEPTPGPPGSPPGPPSAQAIPGVAILLRKYLETFETIEKDVDAIVPEEWTHPPEQPGQGQFGSDSTGLLLQEIQNGDPQEFLDKIKGLPDNQRQLILEEIQKIVAAKQVSDASGPPQPLQPQTAASVSPPIPNQP
jgi:hypothetical protein